MLHAAKLNRALWAEMVHTAVYLHNRVPNRKEDKSPFELWFGHRPFTFHLRIGSTCSVHIPKPQRSGWGKASWTGILVGYGQSNKFYRVYNPESREVITRKDVKVTEPEIKAQASLPEDADEESKGEEPEEPKVEKKGRGRPKGSKNKAKGTPERHQMTTRSKVAAGSPRTPKARLQRPAGGL